jgi:hypothetical protein
LFRYSAAEVDTSGTPVVDGFGCAPGGASLSPFPVICTTQRFASGATVRLQATGTLAGHEPLWSGCDSVAGATCTVVVAGDRAVSLSVREL